MWQLQTSVTLTSHLPWLRSDEVPVIAEDRTLSTDMISLRSSTVLDAVAGRKQQLQQKQFDNKTEHRQNSNCAAIETTPSRCLLSALHFSLF